MTTADHFRSLAFTALLGLLPFPAPPASIRRVLILGYAAIGDFLFFLPVIEHLKRLHPKAHFTFLANPSAVTQEILPATKLIDDVWLFDWEGPSAGLERRNINRRIAESRFDAAILTLSSPAHYFQKGLSRIPLRVGHTRPFEPKGFLNICLSLRRSLITGEPARRALFNAPEKIEGPSEYAVDRNFRLLKGFGQAPRLPAPKPSLPVSPELKAWAEKALAPLGEKKKIAVHLGPPENQYHKIWSPEKFGRLCSLLSAAFPVEFVLIGAAEETASLKSARKFHPLPHSWIGRCSVLETFALIASCDLFIGNDTGLAKAAMILEVPTATIWGPSDPQEVGVAWDSQKHLDIRTAISCSPCARLGMAREGVLNYLNCGHHDCLEKMDENFAFQAIKRKYGPFLDRSQGRPYTAGTDVHDSKP